VWNWDRDALETQYFILKMFVFIVLACRIKGQIREDCAPDPSCFQTCDIINGITSGQPCLERCAINGCVCPNGTVLNEERTECITPDLCKGIHIQYSVW